MTENFRDETVFRDSKQVKGNERTGDDESDSKIYNSRLHLRRWLIAILILLLLTLILLICSIYEFRVLRYATIGEDDAEVGYAARLESEKPGFLVYTNVCRIPDVDPFNSEAMAFYEKIDTLTCEHGSHLPLVDSNLTSIYINPEAISHFYNDSREINCCWRAFHRVEHDDYEVRYDNVCHKFVSSAIISNAEYVRVECTRDNALIYKDFFAFLPRRPLLEKKYKKKKTDHLNVLILGLDAVSRINFHRMMPKTVEALKKHEAVELLGYTKVGLNTFPNLVPAYSGLAVHELQELCWQDESKTFDDCPFIWQNYSASGYRTIFAEDACDVATFNYLKRGFRDPPTDYYLRPYCIAAEKEIGNYVHKHRQVCLGTRKWYQQLLSYAKKVTTQFVNDPYFAIVWQTSMTHDNWNYPQMGDQDYADFIEEMYSENLLRKTVLIVMSDHGFRWGPFPETDQGKMEDSLPFLFIAVPRLWRMQYQLAWNHLQRNTRRLTTPFDLHETLNDFLNYEYNLREVSLVRRIQMLSEGEQLPRGISLFVPIPEHRTCDAADIPGEWCMCHSR